MYREFYALADKPFSLTPDPDFLYLSQSHKEALAHLTYGVESKSGFVMITGEVGSGKTTLLRTLIRNLGDGILLSQVTNTRVSYKELLELILRDFGVDPQGMGKTTLLSALNDFLIERYRDGKNCVLIVDEAQNLGVSSLEGLRMLSNLETEKAKLLHTILVGQPGLRDLIESAELEQLRQRVTVRYHLGPLTVGEVGEYIRHRVAKVASDPDKAPVFPDEVIASIHAASGGIPRLVNVLCDAALLHGYVEESRTIGEKIIGAVAAQVSRDQSGRVADREPEAEALAPEIQSRLVQLEQRLESVVADVRQGSAVATAPDLRQKAALVLKREREVKQREEEVARRALEVERREAEFNRRLAQVKEEWKKRMKNLENARREALGGRAMFPPLRVLVYDPDPRLQNALSELLAEAGIDATVHGTYEEFREVLRECSSGGWFTVAVLGAEQDDAANVARMSELAGEFVQVPRVYLSDLDLSTLRRRMFTAGTNYFIEKPNGRSVSFTSHRDAAEHFKSDVLQVVQVLHRQYKAFFEAVGRDGAEPDNG